MTEGSSPSATLFARLLCDIMIPAEVAMAIRTQGYDVVKKRKLSAGPSATLQHRDGRVVSHSLLGSRFWRDRVAHGYTRRRSQEWYPLTANLLETLAADPHRRGEAGTASLWWREEVL